MSQTYQSQLLWKIGDPATETGAAVTNLTFANGANTQHTFDFNTNPTTAGRMVVGGTLSPLSWATIDTKGCDMLAICSAFKCTAAGGGPSAFGATGSSGFGFAVGTPMRNDNNYEIWAKHPISRLGGNPGATPTFWGSDQLIIYGASSYLVGISDGNALALSDDTIMSAILGYPATALASGQYFRSYIWIGKRFWNPPGVAAATTYNNIPEPSIKGIRQVQFALGITTDCGATAPTGVQYCGEIYAVRIFNTNGYPHLEGIQTA